MAPGKKVQAVKGIKKELEDDVAGRNPIKTIFDFQVRLDIIDWRKSKPYRKRTVWAD